MTILRTIVKFPLLLVLAVLLICLSGSAMAYDDIVDNKFGFTLNLPEGFVPNQQIVQSGPDIIHAFTFGDLTDAKPDIILAIEDMKGTIGRERLRLENMPAELQGNIKRIFTAQWQDYEVDVLEVSENKGGVGFITYNAQIPLKRTAIQVKLFGALDRKKELNDLLEEILDGLKGESNWLPSAAPSLPVTKSENYGNILFAFAIIFVVGGLVAFWFISNRTPQGTILVIAIVVFAIGSSVKANGVREMLMLSGCLKMIGFFGGILGLIDAFRKRKPKD